MKKVEALEDQVNGLRESRNLSQTQLKTIETNLTTQLELAAGRLENLAKLMEG
jgi:hypothetical protein